MRRSAAEPYYAQLADILREQIADGRVPPGALLPSESELCATYGISRTAVRQALQELVLEGVVHKEKGRGTFVSQPKVADLVVHDVRGFFEEMALRGELVTTQIVRQDVVRVPPAVAPALGVRSGGEVVLLERVRVVNGEPIVHVRTYLPAERFERLVDLDLRDRTLYGLLADEFGVTPTAGSWRFDAVEADDDLARSLDVDEGSPLLRVSATNQDADGAVFEHFIAWFRGDRTSFQVLVGAPHASYDTLVLIDA